MYESVSFLCISEVSIQERPDPAEIMYLLNLGTKLT